MERSRTIFDSIESSDLEEEEKEMIRNAKKYKITIETPLITNTQLNDIIATSLEHGCFPIHEVIETLEEAHNNQTTASNNNQINAERQSNSPTTQALNDVVEEIIPIKIEDTEDEDGLTIDGDNWCLNAEGRPIRVDDVIQASKEEPIIPTTPQPNTAEERAEQTQQHIDPEKSVASESDPEEQRQKGGGASSFGRRYRAVQFYGNPLPSNLSSVLFCDCDTAQDDQLITYEEAIANTEGITNSRTAEIEA